jgi:hypothetical protein
MPFIGQNFYWCPSLILIVKNNLAPAEGINFQLNNDFGVPEKRGHFPTAPKIPKPEDT